MTLATATRLSLFFPTEKYYIYCGAAVERAICTNSMKSGELAASHSQIRIGKGLHLCGKHFENHATTILSLLVFFFGRHVHPAPLGH
jgi:hypothetical protein